jgi:hypothetical protein
MLKKRKKEKGNEKFSEKEQSPTGQAQSMTQGEVNTFIY